MSDLSAASQPLDGPISSERIFDGQVVRWDWARGTPPRTLYRHDLTLNMLAVDPNTRRLASGGRDRVLRVYDLDRDTLIAEQRG